MSENLFPGMDVLEYWEYEKRHTTIHNIQGLRYYSIPSNQVTKNMDKNGDKIIDKRRPNICGNTPNREILSQRYNASQINWYE